MNKLQRWMSTATPQQIARLARLSKTSVENLRQVAGAYRTNGKLSTSPELARRIEHATAQLEHVVKRRRVLREELCSACARCDLAKKARSE